MKYLSGALPRSYVVAVGKTTRGRSIRRWNRSLQVQFVVKIHLRIQLVVKIGNVVGADRLCVPFHSEVCLTISVARTLPLERSPIP